MRATVAAAVMAAALALAACAKDPKSVDVTDNVDYRVALLFTHDGCKVYRFQDGRERYFVKCAGGNSRTEFDDVERRYNSSTKSSTTNYYPQSIETIEGER